MQTIKATCLTKQSNRNGSLATFAVPGEKPAEQKPGTPAPAVKNKFTVQVAFDDPEAANEFKIESEYDISITPADASVPPPGLPPAGIENGGVQA